MKLVETRISETTARIRYADNADPTKATQWMDLQFPIADLENSDNMKQPLGEVELQFVAEVHRSVLRRARDLVGQEMKRIAEIAGRIS